MDDHRSRCELEPVECEYYEAGCKVDLVRKDFNSHMSENKQIHILLVSGAFQVKKRQLDECQRERDEYQRKLEEIQKMFCET